MKDYQVHFKSYAHIKLKCFISNQCRAAFTGILCYILYLLLYDRSSSFSSDWMRHIVVKTHSTEKMYRAVLIKYAEYLLTVQWRPFWSCVKAAVSQSTVRALPCCSKDTLQKQCESSACWRAALAATEGKGQRDERTRKKKKHYFIKSLPWIWRVGVKL